MTELKTAIETMGNGTTKSVLQERITELESQIEALALSGDEQTRAVDKAAYSHAKTKIETEKANKLALREKKATEAERNSEEFLVTIAEARVQLQQLEDQFSHQRNTARAKWIAKNDASDATARAAVAIAEQRIEASDKIATQSAASAAKQKIRSPFREVPLDAEETNQVPATAVAAAPSAAPAHTQEVPRWYLQKTHSVAIELSDLADMQAVDWEQVNMQEVHRIWNVLQAIQLQPPSLAYHYKMFGVSPGTLETILGKAAIGKIFAGATAGAVDTISADDTVPDQVINLMKIQLQKLSERLEAEKRQGQYGEAQKGAAEAVAKFLPILQSERKQRGSNPY